MYEPKRPTLAAGGWFTLWVALLSLPMLQGKWLASPWSDQHAAGYAFRFWGAEWWHRLGHVPLWNPELFGGLPFVAAGHGDIFYPTSFLRLVLPVATVVNLGFVIHYILAGLFTYWLLRRLHVSWTGSVIGGLAYELSGLIASYPSPGHDGKLFASAALPLAFLALVMALRDKRWEGYALLAIAVALSLLGHFQIAYYLLIAAGLFAIYLTFGENTSEPGAQKYLRLVFTLGAVLLGFGLAAIQLLPFIQYIPFSPRAQGYHGFEGSTSFAIPWAHVTEFFFKNFAGSRETYWGPNGSYQGSMGLKLHSEYLGLPVIALAVLGALEKDRRRLVLWIGGIGLLFLLVSLGAATPFYQLWWALMPMVKKTRAPGMAFFVVAFVVACFAGLGAERIERKEAGKAFGPWLVVAVVVVLLAVSGIFGSMAEALAGAFAPAARSNASAIMWGAFSSGVALALTATIALAAVRGRLTPQVCALTLVLVVGGDLWLNARHFWAYSPAPTSDLFRADPVIDRLKRAPLPYRVLDLGAYNGSSPADGDVLMAFDIPQVLGYHSNELRYYDELLGRDQGWANLQYIRSWDLLAVRYAIAPVRGRNDSIPGYHRVLDSVPISVGREANLFERVTPQPYARVVPGAFKAQDSSQVVPLLLDTRLDFNRLLIFTPDQAVTPAPIREMPPPSPARATVTAWQPGQIAIALDPAPPAPSYVLVAENWYPDWHATVDGTPAAVLRGNYALLTVPVPAGAKRVELAFRSHAYETGRLISLLSLGVLFALVLAPAAIHRKRNG